MVSLGTETDGSILCPASYSSVVGIKPTVGLTSRAGAVPVSLRQDTIGPICRTVTDAVYVLDEIVGYDPRDDQATKEAAQFIPMGGYKQFLNADGLSGKRIGVIRRPFFEFPAGSVIERIFERHFATMRKKGAILVDNLEIANVSSILSFTDESVAVLAEFKQNFNAYLQVLLHSPVRSLADIISFNQNHITEERMDEFGQDIFLEAEKTNGIGEREREAIQNMERLSRDGIEKFMYENALDAFVSPDASASSVLAIGGYPGITVPAGYHEYGFPFGICFGELRGFEPRLIEIAYAFEQATKARKPLSFETLNLKA